MIVNIKSLNELSKKQGPVKLSKTIGVDYSHLYRVLKKEKNAGLQMINGIQRMCKDEGLDVNDYIFFDIPLSTNNNQSATKSA